MDPEWKFLNECYLPLPAAEYPFNQIFKNKSHLKIFAGVKSLILDVEFLLVNGFP
jgi:hypothetical protein